MDAIERIATSVPGLDQVLQGGIPRYALTLVSGAPGSGKTILVQQVLFGAARPEAPAVYATTLSEPPLKLARYQRTLTFFQQDMVGRSIHLLDLGTPLRRGGLEAAFDALDQAVRQRRPALLAIDSFKAMGDMAADDRSWRTFIFDLAARLPIWGVTAFLVGEYEEADLVSRPEFAVADCILHLYGTEDHRLQRRHLRVMKLRGSGFLRGEHLLSIGPDGIRVYPRRDLRDYAPVAAPGGRVTSGVPGLDDLMGGGLFQGSVALYAGPSGSGKTVLALSFAAAQAAAGRPGLYVSFEEPADHLREYVARLSLDSGDGGCLHLRHLSPVELDLDMQAVQLLEEVRAGGYTWVVLDGVGSLRDLPVHARGYQLFLWDLVTALRRLGVATILTLDTGDPFGRAHLSDQMLSVLADTVMVLRYLPSDQELARGLMVMKMRGSAHDTRLVRFTIGAGGVSLGAAVGSEELR
ncbi:ATPase domain-containing protein [Caldinitratiruptor microaerophilus]|uniref:non-specific serine/threonine protein kinase n=1 Tax=Caldinitratiruptor microaerophilus TaxID=671077 RepID=A0AA35G9R2_9FIRM|nr:ATPase domain-containing protein [Caldinitratiruptor microaerophilus]BDG62346.1 circadian clock protein KaiC [Caldinitratiruptor microaerophilus]